MRTSSCVVFVGVLAAFAASCAPGTNQACRHARPDGTRDLCSDFQSGFSDEDVAAVCDVDDGYTIGAGPCEAGYARCVIDLDGRVFTQHFYVPAEMSGSRAACQMFGGMFEVP